MNKEFFLLEEPKTKYDQWITDNYIKGLVSVIIPTYNRANYIIHTLNSVKNQTYTSIEIIIVDDGSTDNTNEVVKNWTKEHTTETFHVFYYSIPNNGPCSARNYGIIQSKGEYIQFLDSDDIILPEKFSLQVQQIESEKCDASFCNWDYFVDQIPENEEGQLILNPKHELLSQVFFEKKVVIVHSLFWHRTAIIRIGVWDESLRREDDADYFFRGIVQGIKFKYTPSILCYYRCPQNNENSFSYINNEEKLLSFIKVFYRFALSLVENNANYRNIVVEKLHEIACSYIFISMDFTDLAFKKYIELNSLTYPRSIYKYKFLRKIYYQPITYLERKNEYLARQYYRVFIESVKRKSLLKVFKPFFILIFLYPRFVIQFLLKKRTRK